LSYWLHIDGCRLLLGLVNIVKHFILFGTCDALIIIMNSYILWWGLKPRLIL